MQLLSNSERRGEHPGRGSTRSAHRSRRRSTPQKAELDDVSFGSIASFLACSPDVCSSPDGGGLLNSTTALYSTVAIRIKTDGTEMQRSRFTYLLHKSNA